MPDTFLNAYDAKALFQDIESLVEMISCVTGERRLQTALTLRSENKQLGSTVWNELKVRGIAPYRWSDELLTFYRETTAFLFESLVWNRSSQKQAMQRWIAGYLQQRFGRACRILIYGDGLGFDSAALTMLGHEVTYLEVSRKAIAFSRQLFDKLGCNVRMLDDPESIEGGYFDAVVCLDVLEHVPNPVDLVQSIYRCMRKDGCLIVHAPFWYLAKSVGTHLASNRRYSGAVHSLYGKCGMRAVNASWFWAPLVLTQEIAAEKMTKSAAIRFATGGVLLGLARFWSTPHSYVAQLVLNRSLAKWPELDSLIKILEHSDR
ncbi:MAG: class I SAM-dependent methyltransferase [Pirellula sp.]